MDEQMMTGGEEEGKRPEQVPRDLYTREYFTTDCDGYDLFARGAEKLPERIHEAMEVAGDLDGKRVLDIGCGRGELTCAAASRGAHAVGIDYAEAAIELSRESLTAVDESVRQRIEFQRADATDLDYTDGSFDTVFMVDVYEHLHPHEVEATLKEVKRVLRPGGLLVVHTGPSTWFYKFGYPIVRTLARWFLGRELRESLRGEYDAIMHVNEQSPLSLYIGLRDAGFRAKVLPRSFVSGYPASWWEKAAMKLLFTRPFGYFFCMSLMAVATPSEDGREAQLRVGRVLRMMGPRRDSEVLLIGESEGMLAGDLAGMSDIDVTWLEPVGGSDSNPVGKPLVLNGVTRVIGDPYRLPHPDDRFDSIVAQLTLDRIEDPFTALTEWARVLRGGGKLVLVTRNRLFGGQDRRPGPRPLCAFSPDELRRLVEETGLVIGEVSTLIPYLRLPALYRGDLTFSYRFERLPYFRTRGKLIFLSAVKE